jgi:hypothetical protein
MALTTPCQVEPIAVYDRIDGALRIVGTTCVSELHSRSGRCADNPTPGCGPTYGYQAHLATRHTTSQLLGRPVCDPLSLSLSLQPLRSRDSTECAGFVATHAPRPCLSSRPVVHRARSLVKPPPKLASASGLWHRPVDSSLCSPWRCVNRMTRSASPRWVCFAPFSPLGRSHRLWMRETHAMPDHGDCPIHRRI